MRVVSDKYICVYMYIYIFGKYLIYKYRILFSKIILIFQQCDIYCQASVKLMRRRYQCRGLLQLSQVASFAGPAAVTAKNEDTGCVRVRN